MNSYTQQVIDEHDKKLKALPANFQDAQPARGLNHDPLEHLEPLPSRRLSYVDWNDCEPDLSEKPLVRGLLWPHSMALLYGPPGEGKTFVTLDLAAAIAAGIPWFGKNVDRGGVVYCATEGRIDLRIKALKIGKPELSRAKVLLKIVRHSLYLLDPAEVDELIELILKAEAEMGEKVKLVVIDTLARAMGGGDENGSDMGKYTKAAARIQETVKCAILSVHHSGKDMSKGARGNSSNKCAVDTEIVVSGGVIKQTKQRDMATGETIGFRCEQVHIGLDVDGEPVTSCVVRPSSVVEKGSKVSERSLQALEVLRSLSPDNRAKVSVESWRESFRDKHYAGLSRQAASKGFAKAAEELQARGMVIVIDQVAWTVNRQPEVNS